MKVGVIGTGSMGKNHARIYSELKGIEETYFFDVNKSNANEIEDFGAIACGSMGELLDNVHAVSICVPTKYHFQVAKEVIDNDIPCLIEKPITQCVGEAEKLIELLKTKRLIVGVGHIERFNPIVAEISNIIKDPLFVEIRRHNPGSSRITDASVIEDLMIHDIDILFNVLFENNNYTMHGAGNFDICNAMVTFNGSIASISASRKASKKIRTIYIEEEDFTIEGDFMAQDIYTYYKPEKYGMENDRYAQENIIEKVMVNKVEPLKVELKTFIDCVKKNSEFPITPCQALNNLKICEQIKKSYK